MLFYTNQPIIGIADTELIKIKFDVDIINHSKNVIIHQISTDIYLYYIPKGNHHGTIRNHYRKIKYVVLNR